MFGQLQNINVTLPKDSSWGQLGKFLLRLSGLSWPQLRPVIDDELQGTPVAKYGLTRVIDAVGDYFFGEDDEPPAGELIDTLWSKFFGNVDFFDTLDINSLATTALTAVRDWVINTVVTQIVKWLAPLLAARRAAS